MWNWERFPRLRLSPRQEAILGWLALVAIVGYVALFWYASSHHRRGHYGIPEIISAFCSIPLTLLGIALALYLIAIFCVPILVAAAHMRIHPAILLVGIVISGAVTFQILSGSLQTAAFVSWRSSPFGYQYGDGQAIFDDHCATEVQDGENSHHIEFDYHDGEQWCSHVARLLTKPLP
jgi:hypothetical protein